MSSSTFYPSTSRDNTNAPLEDLSPSECKAILTRLMLLKILTWSSHLSDVPFNIEIVCEAARYTPCAGRPDPLSTQEGASIPPDGAMIMSGSSGPPSSEDESMMDPDSNVSPEVRTFYDVCEAEGTCTEPLLKSLFYETVGREFQNRERTRADSSLPHNQRSVDVDMDTASQAEDTYDNQDQDQPFSCIICQQVANDPMDYIDHLSDHLQIQLYMPLLRASQQSHTSLNEGGAGLDIVQKLSEMLERQRIE